MRIMLNGKNYETTATTLKALAEEINAPIQACAIEQNATIIPRSLHSETTIAENDIIEIVGFIGGG